MAAFSQTITADTTPERLWALVRDVRRVAGLFPFTDVTEFTELAPARWRYRRALRIPHVADLHWDEEARITGERTLEFAAVGGDLAIFAGQWSVAPQDNGAQLHLELEYEIPDALRPNMPANLASYVMAQLFTTICERIKTVAEQGDA